MDTTNYSKVFQEEQVVTTLTLTKPDQDTEVVAFYNEALGLKKYAEARVIAATDDLKPATEDLSLIAKLKKAMEEKRKEYVKPLQDHVKSVNDTFKTLMEPVEMADHITREKILAFQLKQKLIREEQERINALRLEAAKKEMELKGELTESVNLVEVTPEVAKRTTTDMGSAGMRDNWRWKVVDFSLVPDDYKVIDSAMLTTIARKHHDSKPVLGIEFYNEPILAVNTR